MTARSLFRAAVALALSSVTQAAQGQPTTPNPCTTDPNGPKCIGRWMDPIELCAPTHPIGCNKHSIECGVDPCTTGCNPGDEIAHAALIPSGPLAGQVLLWTRCDNAQNPFFATYFWNPIDGQISGSATFPAGTEDAFCAGHVWVLDAEGKAKLFTVGGSLTNRCYWFDAESTLWSSDPVDLPATNYYASVVTYGDDTSKSSVVAVIGGTVGSTNAICAPDPDNLFQAWWSLPSPFTSGSWVAHATTHTTSDGWHQYPRSILLSQRSILSAGHVVACEDAETDLNLTMDFGGNPTQFIDTVSGTHQELANIDPNSVFAGGFSMGYHQPIRGWNYDNAAILHTLQPGWTWTTDATAALAQYELDRVLAFGGAPKLEPLSYAYFAHSVTLELQGAPSQPANQWTWREKARASSGRGSGNWVILPTGKLLAVGGGVTKNFPLATTEQFDPQRPTQNGVWKSMHTRPNYSGAATSIQRMYHSVALLLPGGEVAMIGGQQLGGQLNSMHTLEIYRPPYLYYTARPSLTNVPSTIHYPEGTSPNTFCVQTNAAQVSRASLIGVASVTHHFDYGQRYVELMVRQVSCGSGNVEILPPPKSTLAPPGYYILFLIDWQGLPSPGKILKLDYQRP